MADRTLRRLWAYLPNGVRISGKFAVGATGAVGAITAIGIASITRTAAGKYSVVMSDRFADLYLESISLVSSATVGDGENLMVQFNSYNAATKTFTFVCNPSGASQATETDPASGDEIHFAVVGRNTGIPR